MSTINISENELRRLLNERDTLNKTLTDTVNRCSELLEDSRQKGRRIKALEAELEALRSAWSAKLEVNATRLVKRKVWTPPPDWKPPTEEEMLELMNGPTLVSFAQKQGVKATDVLMHLLGKGMEGVHINTRLDRETVTELTEKFPKKEPKKEELPIVEAATPTSESLPRQAIESPHKQPPFKPVDPDPFDRNVVIDGGGARWRDRTRFD